MPGERTFIIGGGMTAFIKPRGKRDTADMGLEAATKALLDAGVTYDKVEAAYVGYCYGDSCCGQRALYPLGLNGIPITNVNNNCATGSTALYQANTLVKSGIAHCALALGFEQMKPGSLGTNWPDRRPPMEPWGVQTLAIEEANDTGSTGPMAARMFGNGAIEYSKKYGSTREHLAKIASKNHTHGSRNEYAQFRTPWTPEQVLASGDVTANLTKLMCCPTSDGAACIIVASESFVRKHKLENQAIEIVSQAMVTDVSGVFDAAQGIAGAGMTKLAGEIAFKGAGFGDGKGRKGRDEVGVVELHDCFAANELITYDALGLSNPGEAHKLVDAGDNTYGGKYVINPSGGLEAKGHPLGATGLGMHFYVMTQLRGWAGPMQAPGVENKYGLVHNLGLGGAAVVSLLHRPEFYREGGKDGRDRVGYNHAHECRGVTLKDVEKVRAPTYSQVLIEQARL